MPKSASSASFAQRRALGAFVLLQDGPVQGASSPQQDAQENADLIKATSHFLGGCHWHLSLP